MTPDQRQAPPIPSGASRYRHVSSRTPYTVYDHDDCRWRFARNKLHTFLRYNATGGIVEVIHGDGYKPTTHREGKHKINDQTGMCIKCGCTREQRLDNLPHTKTCLTRSPRKGM